MALYYGGFYVLSGDLRFSDCNACSCFSSPLSLSIYLSFMFMFSCEIYEQKVKFSYLVYADIT